MKRNALAVCLAVLALSLIATASYGDRYANDYKVTITNLTGGETFTPILILTHKKGVKLFTPGSPASSELAMLAEGGDTVPLTERMMRNPKVGHIMTTGGLLGPGQSVTVQIPAERYRYISIASMLIPTNDAFMALNGVKAAKGHKSVMYLSPAWDAGSEINDESCANIPGPFGCDGNGVGYSDEDGEGFVHIHSGIHGTGDLAPYEFDWKNPVARVVIEKTGDHDGDDDDD